MFIKSDIILSRAVNIYGAQQDVHSAGEMNRAAKVPAGVSPRSRVWKSCLAIILMLINLYAIFAIYVISRM